MPLGRLGTLRSRWPATVALVAVTALTACSAAPLPSRSESAARLTPAASAASEEPPSPAASSGIGSTAPTASPGPVRVRATVLSANLPTGLGRAVAVAVGSRILVYGGFTSTGITTDAIVAFDPASGDVARVGHLADAVHDAAGVALGGATLIFGGGSVAPTSAVQRIDASGVGERIGNLPAARADLSAVVVGSSALVIGGGASGLLDRRVLATEDGVHFHTLATLVAGVRYAAVAEVGGLIYVIGGVGAAGDRTEIQRIDPTNGRVTVVGRMPRPISHASAMVIDGRLLVVGGRSAGKAQDAIWQVDQRTGTARLVAHLPQPVSDFAVAVIGKTGYLIGGETGTQIATIVSIVIQ